MLLSLLTRYPGFPVQRRLRCTQSEVPRGVTLSKRRNPSPYPHGSKHRPGKRLDGFSGAARNRAINRVANIGEKKLLDFGPL